MFPINVSNQFISQQMCNETFTRIFILLLYILNRFKSEELCDETVVIDTSVSKYIPEHRINILVLSFFTRLCRYFDMCKYICYKNAMR